MPLSLSPELSVVLPTYNGMAHIGEQLAALSNQHTSVRWELVLVDNASNDGTRALLDDIASADGIRVIDAPAEHNLAYVRNVGAAASESELLVFVDDDDVVAPGFITAMARALHSVPIVACVLEYTELNSPDLLIGRAAYRSEGLESALDTPVAHGGGLGVHRTVWNQLGGNDVSWSFTGEDTDFSLRATRDLGIVPVAVLDAVMHVRLRSGARNAFVQGFRYGRSHVHIRVVHGDRRRLTSDEARSTRRDWWYIATRWPLAVAGIRRELWCRRTGVRAGRLIQSLREPALLP